MRCKLLESQIYIAVNGEYRFCCTADGPSTGETVYTHTPEQWLNSPTVLDARAKLQADIWPEQCKRCQIEESSGLISRRIDRDEMGPGITHLDIRLGNSCNLKCISCGSQSSSSINQENIDMKRRGIIPLTPVLENSVENWYDSAFFKYFAIDNLVEVALAGGEPMMIRHLDKFLEQIDSSATIRMTTNGTVFNQRLFDLLKKFRKVIMTVSIDAIGTRNDYIRYGSDWNTIEQNTLRYRQAFKVDVSPTISILNAIYYDEIVDWGKRNDIKIYDNLLLNPDWLHIKNAPENLKSQIKHFDSWKNEPGDPQQIQWFVENILKLDQYRNIRIQDYLPEVAAAYGIS